MLDLTGPIRAVDIDEIIEPVKPPAIKALRDSHHNVAKLVALGLRNAEVSLQTGYSLSRISVLLDDPTFQELVAFYHADNARVERDIEGLLRQVGLDSMQAYHEKLLDDPDSIPDALKVEASKIYLDRAGHSPINRSVTKSFSVGIGMKFDKAHGRSVKDAA